LVVEVSYLWEVEICYYIKGFWRSQTSKAVIKVHEIDRKSRSISSNDLQLSKIIKSHLQVSAPEEQKWDFCTSKYRNNYRLMGIFP
jgi:hypothetical protein